MIEAGPDDHRGEPAAAWVVAVAWAFLLAAAATFVARHGRDLPYLDDWDLVPVLAGEQPADGAWLWSQLNEHRVPLPRLLLLGLYRATGNDFRAGMAFNVGALGLLAALLPIGLRKSRGGRSTYSDAFFPILLLGPAQVENLLWSWQAVLVLTALLAGLWLATVAGPGDRPNGRSLIAGGLLLVALSLCGAGGLVFVPPGALWLILAATPLGGGRWRPLPILLALAALGLVGAYFVGYRRPDHFAASPGPWASLVATSQFSAGAFGPAARSLWPISGIVVVGLLATAVIAVLVAWKAKPEERLRALGLLAFLAGAAGLAIGVGWGRAGSGPSAGFEGRYATLAAPALCGAYVAWDRLGPRGARGLLPAILCGLAIATTWPNAQYGRAYGENYARRMDAFRTDLASGRPPFELIRRHTPFVNYSQDSLVRYLPMLREARIGPFRRLAADPPMTAIAIPAAPRSVSGASWQPGTARADGPSPTFDYAVDPPRNLAGIRLTFDHANPQGLAARFRLDWSRDPGVEPGTDPALSFTNWAVGTGRVTTTVWVADTVARFRVRFDDRPSTINVEKVELLIPSGPPP